MHSLSLFRRSFAQSIGLLFLALLVFQGLGLGLEVLINLNNEGFSLLGQIPWREELWQGFLYGGLMAILLPWFLLAGFSEWFQTRSLKRKELTTLLWREYFYWWSGLSLLLIIMAAFAEVFPENVHSLSWITALSMMGFSLYFALLLSGDEQVIWRQLLPLPLFILWIWGKHESIMQAETFQALFQNTWIIKVFMAPVGITLGSLCLIWAAYQTWRGQHHSHAPNTSNFTFENFFFKTFSSKKPIALKPFRHSWQKAWSQYRLLSGETHAIFMVLSLACGLILFSLIMSHYLPAIMMRQWQLYQVSDLLLTCLILTVLLTSIPNYVIWGGRSELLFTRAINKSKVYLFNLFSQSIISSIPLMIILGLLLAGGEHIQFMNVALLALFMLLAGPLTLVVLIVPMIVGQTWMPFGSLITQLTASHWSAYLIWGLALLGRLCEYYFINHSTSHNQGFARFKLVGKAFLLPAIPISLALLAGLHQHPLLRFVHFADHTWLSQRTKYAVAQDLQTLQLMGPVYLKKQADKEDDSFYRQLHYSTNALQKALKAPHDNDTAMIFTQESMAEIEEHLLDSYQDLWYQEAYSWERLQAFNHVASYWLPLTDMGPKTLRWQSMQALFHDDPKTALKLAQEALTKIPEPQSYEYLARIQALFYQEEQALQTYAQMRNTFPERRGKSYRLEGKLLYSAGKYAEALEAYTQAIEHQDQTEYLTPQYTVGENLVIRFPYYTVGLCSENKRILNRHRIKGFRGFEQMIKITQKLCQNQELSRDEATHIFGSQEAEYALWLLDHQRYALAKEVFNTSQPQWRKTLQAAVEGNKNAQAAIHWLRENPYLFNEEHTSLFYSSNTGKYLGWYSDLLTKPEQRLDRAKKILVLSADFELELTRLQKVLNAQEFEELKAYHQELKQWIEQFEHWGVLNLSNRHSLALFGRLAKLKDIFPEQLNQTSAMFFEVED